MDLERSGASLLPAGSGSTVPQRSRDYNVAHFSQESTDIIIIELWNGFFEKPVVTREWDIEDCLMVSVGGRLLALPCEAFFTLSPLFLQLPLDMAFRVLEKLPLPGVCHPQPTFRA